MMKAEAEVMKEMKKKGMVSDLLDGMGLLGVFGIPWKWVEVKGLLSTNAH